MGFMYAGLWFLAAVLLFIKFRKESAIIYVLSLYFLFAGVWWLWDQLSPADMMNGTYGWILRIVSLMTLIVTGIVYSVEKGFKTRKDGAEQSSAALANQQE